MPPPTHNPEAVARAVLEKAPAARARLTSHQERAGQIRQKVQEGQEPRSIIEGMRDRSPVNKRRLEEISENNIGTERKPEGTKNRDSDEQRRFAEAKKSSEQTKDFIEKGFDHLNPTQQAELRKDMEAVVNTWPEAQAIFSGKTPAEKQALLEQFIKDPALTAKVRANFERATDPSNKLVDNVSSLQNNLTEINRQLSAKNAEISLINGQRAFVDVRLEEFSDRSAVGGIKGAKLAEIEKITAEMPELNADLESYRDQMDEMKDELRTLNQMVNVANIRGEDATNLRNQVAIKNGELRNAKKEIARISGRIDLKAKYEQERAELIAGKQQLEAGSMQLNEELRNLNEDQSKASAEVANAKSTRVSQEEDYVDSLKEVFSESAMEYLIEKAQAAEDAERALLDDEIANAEDPAEKAILEGLKNRWDQDKVEVVGFWKFKKKQTLHVLNKKQIDTDFNNLVKIGGDPKDVMKSLLIANGFTDIQADAKLKDKEFVAQMQPRVLERLVAKKLQTGGMNESEARRIVESDWGGGVIQGAIAKNKEVSNALNELVNQGVISSTSTESLKKLGGKNLLWILLLILGGAVAGSIGLGKMANKAIQ